MQKRHAWHEASVTTLPVMFGYLPLGAAFGILAIEVGIPVWGALLMSLVIYAGAGQFLAVALLAAGAGLVEVAVATLMLNSRHLFYGLSLLKRFQGAGWRKPYLIFALTDETYSLLTTHGGERELDHAQAFRLSLLNQLWWVLGSVAGVLIGTTLEFDSRGIEFALTALFIVLTLEQARRLRQWLPFAIALVTGIGAVALLPDRHLLLGAIGATTLVLLVDHRRRQTHREAPTP
ncbi:AzlC family ABC transporter permease [Halomonas saccharevitans]|uniref:4-azaleucine resistance probable transporter AzlC n=1 Tax=Halomonas saccharevitans TaxID=416872 RepID=A0A1I6ZYV6_9GAMM|nr:AzlC family ABC transporter permease [Halomonas saccharevitans]MDT8878205.1 AzlC family ABC transporter permease [Halomonas saccharevitans]SFT67843.1 4-azaleucine resistance probable transporter AzlC [Halomonas saccharevitans]